MPIFEYKVSGETFLVDAKTKTDLLARMGNVPKTNVVAKGLSTIFFYNFDMVRFFDNSTPPVQITNSEDICKYLLKKMEEK